MTIHAIYVDPKSHLLKYLDDKESLKISTNKNICIAYDVNIKEYIKQLANINIYFAKQTYRKYIIELYTCLDLIYMNYIQGQYHDSNLELLAPFLDYENIKVEPEAQDDLYSLHKSEDLNYLKLLCESTGSKAIKLLENVKFIEILTLFKNMYDFLIAMMSNVLSLKFKTFMNNSELCNIYKIFETTGNFISISCYSDYEQELSSKLPNLKPVFYEYINNPIRYCYEGRLTFNENKIYSDLFDRLLYDSQNVHIEKLKFSDHILFKHDYINWSHSIQLSYIQILDFINTFGSDHNEISKNVTNESVNCFLNKYNYITFAAYMIIDILINWNGFFKKIRANGCTSKLSGFTQYGINKKDHQAINTIMDITSVVMHLFRPIKDSVNLYLSKDGISRLILEWATIEYSPKGYIWLDQKYESCMCLKYPHTFKCLFENQIITRRNLYIDRLDSLLDENPIVNEPDLIYYIIEKYGVPQPFLNINMLDMFKRDRAKLIGTIFEDIENNGIHRKHIDNIIDLYDQYSSNTLSILLKHVIAGTFPDNDLFIFKTTSLLEALRAIYSTGFRSLQSTISIPAITSKEDVAKVKMYLEGI